MMTKKTEDSVEETEDRFSDEIIDEVIKKSLTLFFSGVYLTNQDLLNVVYRVGIEEPLKSKEMILKNSLSKLSKENRIGDLISVLIELIENRKGEYLKIIQNYPKGGEVLRIWFDKSENYINELKNLQNSLKKSSKF